MNFVSTKIISNLLNQILMLYLQYMIKLCENLNFIQKGVLENNIKVYYIRRWWWGFFIKSVIYSGIKAKLWWWH